MTNQAKECCEWNEAVEAAAKVAENYYGGEIVSSRIRSLKRAPSHQAGQEGDPMSLVERLRNPMWVHGPSLDSPAALSVEETWRDMEKAATRIETLKSALREIIGAAEHCGDGDAPVVIKARNALTASAFIGRRFGARLGPRSRLHTAGTKKTDDGRHG